MFDMGPYYVTAMVALLGPAARVTGSAQTPFAVKAYSDPATAEYGQTFAVETPSIVSGTIDFRDSMAENKAAGTVGSITTTCEIFGYNPRLEIYGTEGILVCNDPNMFGRSVFVRRRNSEGLQEVPYTHGLAENSRGVGAADMAYAVRDDRPHRASGDLMFHVLDIMQGIHEASEQGRHIEMQSSVERPAPLAPGLLPNVLAL
jgi:predicted dehydrogenase